MKRLRPGDLVYFKSIDRLGRNYQDIQEQWRIITKEKKADIVVLDMALLDTRRGKDLLGTFIADLVLGLLSFVAQQERDFIKQRQAKGIAAAKAGGAHLGRPTASEPPDFNIIVAQWQRGALSSADALRLSGLPKTTFYRKAAAYST